MLRGPDPFHRANKKGEFELRGNTLGTNTVTLQGRLRNIASHTSGCSLIAKGEKNDFGPQPAFSVTRNTSALPEIGSRTEVKLSPISLL